jgi:flagellar biosynthesis/type III secretory pathway protein FliH
MPNRRPPSRRRYEAAHPSLTVRVPAAVKAQVQAAAAAEGLSVSEWVQAMAAGHTPDVTAAYEKGRAVGQQAGAAAGYQRGRLEGEPITSIAGFRAGLLASLFAADHDRAYDAATVAQRVVADPAQRAIVDRLLPAHYQADWARLVRQVTGRR